MSAQSTAASECPLRVKGGCGRWADGAAGVPPSFGNNPSVPGPTFRAISGLIHRSNGYQYHWPKFQADGETQAPERLYDQGTNDSNSSPNSSLPSPAAVPSNAGSQAQILHRYGVQEKEDTRPYRLQSRRHIHRQAEPQRAPPTVR